MEWLSRQAVLSAVSQKCGGKECINSLDEFFEEACLWDVAYCAALSGHLPSMLARIGAYTDRDHESLSPELLTRLVSLENSPPAELYMSHVARPNYYVDYKNKGKMDKVSAIVRSNCATINAIFDAAFKEYHEHGANIDDVIDREVFARFSRLDWEMQGMLRGYLKQKPRRMLVSFDVEPVNVQDPGHIFREPEFYFYRLEPIVGTIEDSILGMNSGVLRELTGKLYHLEGRVPLTQPGYELHGVNYAMLNMMSEGGTILPETMDELCTANDKPYPTPLLAQRAYQGLEKAKFAFLLSIRREMEQRLQRAGIFMPITFTDNEPYSASLDCASMTKICNMNVTSFPGQFYKPEKPKEYPIFRMIAATNGRFLFPSIRRMLEDRCDPGAVEYNLISNSASLPDMTNAVEGMLKILKDSDFKHSVCEPTEGFFSPEYQEQIRRNNYGVLRNDPAVDRIIDDPGEMMNPGALNYVFSQMADADMGVRDMVEVMHARYYDKDHPRRIRLEPHTPAEPRCLNWPRILRGQYCRA